MPLLSGGNWCRRFGHRGRSVGVLGSKLMATSESGPSEPTVSENGEKESANTPSKLVVFGGNGFVGSRVCEAGVRQGLNVVSISRSGERTFSLQLVLLMHSSDYRVKGHSKCRE